MLKLHNTLGKKIEAFAPNDPKHVRVYCCGPTVYDYAHIGNFRTYTMTDFLVRTLVYLGYPVKYVTNITDVGHLVSDSDDGEDKMEKGAKRDGKTAWDIAKFYADAFLEDSKKLNLLEPDVRPKPTEHIPQQIAMVETLLSRGFAYTIDDGIYFDTSKFAHYGALTGQNQEDLKAGARVEPNPQKKNPSDFALWKFSYPKGRSFDPAQDASRRDMEWESPWGVGFPGWHIECSAMIGAHLGTQIDIHTGGADLIPVHHTNEIAQSEAATGLSPFVKYWVHGQFIMVDGAKMSKSLGNFYRLADVEVKGYEPLALRYLYLTAHYRAFLNFTWEAIGAAQQALTELRSIFASSVDTGTETDTSTYVQRFTDAISNDLNMPQALAVVWEMARSNLRQAIKRELLLDFDRVLGVDLARAPEKDDVPDVVMELVAQRESMRRAKNFVQADALRGKIEQLGYSVEDSAVGMTVKKIRG
jgi:cysteinyl-tRNA synthetase